MSTPREALEARLAAALGRGFTDSGRLSEALTHSSAESGKRRSASNERMEFLGDRVLGLVIADALFERFPDAPEGELAPRFNALVRRETCARIARQIGLDAAIVMNEGEEETGGREKTAILGDACEAVIAALYLDRGLESRAPSFSANGAI